MRKFWEKPIIGIYKITHRESGKCYIGQSKDVFKRWQGHSNLAVKKKSAIQHAFVLYGIDKFSFEVIEETSLEMLNEREIFWIAHFGSVSPNGYNLTSGGGQGTTVSDETKEKHSAAMKGKKLGPKSEKHRTKISAKLKGRKKPQPQVQCPHCSKNGALNIMKRWHFENCKIYKELGVPKLGEETTPDSRSLNALLFPK